MKLTFIETIQLNELSFDDLSKSELYQKVLASPKFQSWFGPSKVRDENGNPLICFHGTDAGFYTFQGLSHFGTKEAADTRIEISTNRYGVSSRIIPVFLRITNPVRIYDIRGNHYSIWSYLFPMVQHDYVTINQVSTFLDAILKQEQKYLVTGELIDYQDRPKKHGIYAKFISRMKKFSTDLDFYNDKRYRTIFLKFLRSLNIDGFVYENEIEDAGNESWVITSPGQVLPVFRAGRLANE